MTTTDPAATANIDPVSVVAPVDPALQRKAFDELSRAAMALVLEEPFFGHLLSGVNREVTTLTGTAAVAIRGPRPVLRVNPEFFTQRITRRNERVAVVKHEVLHLLLRHLFRVDWDRTNRLVFNLAADIVVNQFVGSKWKLPEGAVTLDTFPQFDLEPDRSVEWYYERLMQHVTEIEVDFTLSPSDHNAWGVFDGSANGAMARQEVARLAERARQRSGRHFSQVDEPIRRIVDALIEELEPTVDWRRVVRMFANSSRRTRVSNTLRRPSKRYGTYPGIKVKRFHRLAVAIDTSGSISDRDLAEFFGEVNGIYRQGSEVTIVEADETVQREWEYRAGTLPTSVGGRGGTDFDPVLMWLREPRRRSFDALIYLTDGQAPTPTVSPVCPVLWVLTPDGSDATLTSGRVIRINR